MILAEVFALLCNEPNCLRPWDVRRLTLRQVFGIYQWPRDNEGQLVFEPRPDDGAEDFQGAFYRAWQRRRLPEHHIDRKWREHEEEARRTRGG